VPLAIPGVVRERPAAFAFEQRAAGVVDLEVQGVLDDQRHAQPVDVERVAAEHAARRRAPQRGEQFQAVADESGIVHRSTFVLRTVGQCISTAV